MGVEIIFAALHALVGSETMAKILERTARTAAWFCTSAHGPHQLQVVEERITTCTPLKNQSIKLSRAKNGVPGVK
jgi:hypothetical protein